MGKFNQGDRGDFRSGARNGDETKKRDFDRPNFQKKNWEERGFRNKEPMMHQAICSECGKRCEVPFRPASGKPVYCTDCFSSKRGGEGSRGDRIPARMHYEKKLGDGNDIIRRQLADMNMKLDRLIKAVEAFTGTGPKAVVIEASKKEEKKSIDVAGLKKALDTATEKEPVKTEDTAKESIVILKKGIKKTAAIKKKK